MNSEPGEPVGENPFLHAIQGLDLNFAEESTFNIGDALSGKDNSPQFQLGYSIERGAPIALWESFTNIPLDWKLLQPILLAIKNNTELTSTFSTYRDAIEFALEHPQTNLQGTKIVGDNILPKTLGTKDVLTILSHIANLDDSEVEPSLLEDTYKLIDDIQSTKKFHVVRNLKIAGIEIPDTGKVFVTTTSNQPRAVTRQYSDGTDVEIIYIPFDGKIGESELIDLASNFDSFQDNVYPEFQADPYRDIAHHIVDADTTPSSKLIESVQSYIWIVCREMHIVGNFYRWLQSEGESENQKRILKSLKSILKKYKESALINISDPFNEANFIDDKPQPLKHLTEHPISFTSRPDSPKLEEPAMKSTEQLYQEISDLFDPYLNP